MKTSARQTVLALTLLVALAIVALPQRAMSQAASLLFGSYSGAAKAVTVTSAGYLNVSFGGGPINTGTAAFSFTRQEATPTAPTLAQVVDMSGLCTAGTHKFAVGVNTATGHSITSAASSNVTCDATHTKVTVTIPVGSVYGTSRDIYASKAGTSSPLFLVSTSPVVNDNTTVTYTFNLADASLTATVAPTTNTTADVTMSVANNGAVTVAGSFAPAGLTPAGTVGVPTVVAYGNTVAATNTGTASIATVTPAVDTTYEVGCNILVTTSTTHSFSCDVTYTDEGNTSRTMVLPVVQLAGSFVTTGLITNVTGAGPYESPVMTIRAKASTAATIRTSAGGTFTTVVYNARGIIKQVS